MADEWVVYDEQGRVVGRYKNDQDLVLVFGRAAKITRCLEIRHPVAPDRAMVARPGSEEEGGI